MVCNGRMVNKGMGGFLNPPEHPEHWYSVSGRDFFMSLAEAAKCDWLDEHTRSAALTLLKRWQPLPLNDGLVEDWIHQILGYFKNCYSPDGTDRRCACCLIPGQNAPKELELPIDWHLGVMHIREFYPGYRPEDEDFQYAYWGKKTAAQ